MDPYGVLKIPRSASRDQIRRAFRKLAKDLHPDVNPKPDAKERFQALEEAQLQALKVLDALDQLTRKAKYAPPPQDFSPPRTKQNGNRTRWKSTSSQSRSYETGPLEERERAERAAQEKRDRAERLAQEERERVTRAAQAQYDEEERRERLKRERDELAERRAHERRERAERLAQERRERVAHRA